jgi:hypothetical protein
MCLADSCLVHLALLLIPQPHMWWVALLIDAHSCLVRTHAGSNSTVVAAVDDTQQVGLNAAARGDLSVITGSPAKLGISALSVAFDVIFIVQVWVCICATFCVVCVLLCETRMRGVHAVGVAAALPAQIP